MLFLLLFIPNPYESDDAGDISTLDCDVKELMLVLS